MSSKEIDDLLYGIPTTVDYTDLPEELDEEDIPSERIDGLLNIINKEMDIYLLFRASFLLNSWGIDEGFNKMTELLFSDKISYLIINNLKSLDDTYKHALSSYISYWAVNSDHGNGEKARKKIYQPIKIIIDKANIQPFQINSLFWVIKKEGFYEYIPLLKQHLTKLLRYHMNMYWEIHDLSKFLLDLGFSEFINKIFYQNNKGLSDYGL
ncbi:hypothetical protein LU293_00080 [Moraxella nasovis]|uniref:hypothetical protein n=1 Tax=Moraxella nasovis TaxID=2904121 RepID=UPI001F5FF7AB|nr:hypothetical protein [Moraxella nasovis]UNU73351.1 hypothetical protein LU293_00080 [Moraxella nasovis]